MAFLKFVASIALGGGLGYTLFSIASANKSELIKHLQQHSSEKRGFFEPYTQQSEKFMNQEKPNFGFKEYKTQDSANGAKK